MASRGYAYRITVQPTATPKDDQPLGEPLIFDATNHDDILVIAGRLRANSGLDPDDAASVAIGMKLLTEVMLKQKANPLFDPLRPAVREFIGNLKALSKTAAAD